MKEPSSRTSDCLAAVTDSDVHYWTLPARSGTNCTDSLNGLGLAGCILESGDIIENETREAILISEPEACLEK